MLQNKNETLSCDNVGGDGPAMSDLSGFLPQGAQVLTSELQNKAGLLWTSSTLRSCHNTA